MGPNILTLEQQQYFILGTASQIRKRQVRNLGGMVSLGPLPTPTLSSTVVFNWTVFIQ